MTKRQFRQKVQELIKKQDKYITEKIEKLLTSGCIDLESAENNYMLPRAFMCAISKDMVVQWRPLCPDLRKEAENIGKFI